MINKRISALVFYAAKDHASAQTDCGACQCEARIDSLLSKLSPHFLLTRAFHAELKRTPCTFSLLILIWLIIFSSGFRIVA
jgi:hypothetical protein